MSQKDEESISKISRMLEIGGTMLAQHCAECGAPLFRYKGNVICPLCDTGPKPAAQAQKKPVEKQTDVSSSISGDTEPKKGISSSVGALPSPVEKPSEVKDIGAVNINTLPGLEEMLTKKTVMLAQSMQQEQDPRKIKEFLELIEKSLDIIDRLKK